MSEYRPSGPADLWWNISPLGRIGILLLAGTLLAVVGAMLFSGGGSDDGDPPVIVGTVTPSPDPTQTPITTQTPTTTPPPTATAAPDQTATPVPDGTAAATATATPAPSNAPTPTPEPGPDVVVTIDDLHDRYGEPPGAVFGRMRVPALGIDAPVGVRLVGGDGQMPNPAGPSDVIWYDFSGWEGIGGAIGGGGNAVFSGHVDYAARVPYAGVDYRGRGVFFSLSLLSPGDVIEVESAGQTIRYAVSWRQTVDAAETNWGEMLSADVSVDSITLITCGGEFDFDSRSYVDRVVIRAERI